MIYFDNAATAFPKKPCVAAAAANAVLRLGNPGRSGHSLSLESAKCVFSCREKLARMFGTLPERVIFTSGATAALNTAIKGTNVPGGVTVVSSVEHNSVMRPADALCRAGLTAVRCFRVDTNSDKATLEHFRNVAEDATNVIVTHASNVCGRVLPVAEMRALVPQAVFVLDASQTAGHIPVSFAATGADIICIPAHKGLCGPMGLGALMISPESDVLIAPLCEGGTGTNSASRLMPEEYPERLEAGTLNVPGIAGLSAALDALPDTARESEVFGALLDGLSEVKGVELYGAPAPGAEGKYVPVLLFNIRGKDCEDVAAELSARGFAIRAGYHCAPDAHKTIGSFDAGGGVRVSVGASNTVRDAQRLVYAVSRIAAG